MSRQCTVPDLTLSRHLQTFVIIRPALQCKFLPHENYGDWELQGPCTENLQYPWKRAVRIAGRPCDNYRPCNYHGVPVLVVFMG